MSASLYPTVTVSMTAARVFAAADTTCVSPCTIFKAGPQHFISTVYILLKLSWRGDAALLAGEVLPRCWQAGDEDAVGSLKCFTSTQSGSRVKP
jgi:hypothetical protein